MHTDFTVPLLSGAITAGADYYMTHKGAHIEALKVGGIQAISVLGSNMLLGSFINNIAPSLGPLAGYAGDLVAALVFSSINCFVFNKGAFSIETFAMDALYSFLSIEIARGIEAPLKPYLPKFITGSV